MEKRSTRAPLNFQTIYWLLIPADRASLWILAFCWTRGGKHTLTALMARATQTLFLVTRLMGILIRSHLIWRLLDWRRRTARDSVFLELQSNRARLSWLPYTAT